MKTKLAHIAIVASAVVVGIAAAVPALAGVQSSIDLPSASTISLLAGAIVGGILIGPVMRFEPED